MKVIKSETGFNAFHGIFKNETSRAVGLVLWQHSADDKRNIFKSPLISFDPETALLNFHLPGEFIINEGLPLYCYSEAGLFIFKTSVSLCDKENNLLCVNFPREINMLAHDEASAMTFNVNKDLTEIWRTKRLGASHESSEDYMKVKSMSERSARDQDFLKNEFTQDLSLEEEEKMFADKREAPRARPKEAKWVKVQGSDSDQVHLLRLFDLSQGGISFITLEPHLFHKGTTIKVVGFSEFDLDDPLVGEVVSHRTVDDLGIEHKIGVKFNEGQD